MGTVIYILFISIFMPLFLMMLLVEKKARLPIVFVLVGIFVSVFASEVNGVLLTILNITRYDATITLAPVTEEILKAFPILFYAIVVSDKKEELFTASMATGIGFAILENAYYLIINRETFSILSALIRGFGTSFIRKRYKLFAAVVFALLSLAITYHSLFNMLIQSKYHIVGALLPLITYLPFFLWRHFKKQGKKQNAKNIQKKGA